MFCARGVSGKPYQRNLAAPVQSTTTSRSGTGSGSFWSSGALDWRNTMKWKGSLGTGKASMALWSRPHWPSNAWEPIQPIGEKNGRKRSLLVDERGVPLSLVASGANVHDVKLFAPTLDQLVIARPRPTSERQQNLCADAGYKGSPALGEAQARNYQPHIKQRREEADAKRTEPGYKARRWAVERTHSWLNRYRKLLVSFEKTEGSYVALLCLAAAMICWRRTTFIYG
jgi:transposase